MNDVVSLLGFLAAAALTATAGGLFRPGDWYERLRKPPWRPPNWLFGPVWAVLYVMIAVSGWLVFTEAGVSGAMTPLLVYFVHLGLNWLWSAVFFGLRRPDLAFVEIVFLWMSIVLTMILFYPISPLAAYLLAPYLAWASFAAVLNLEIWRLNKSQGVFGV